MEGKLCLERVQCSKNKLTARGRPTSTLYYYYSCEVHPYTYRKRLVLKLLSYNNNKKKKVFFRNINYCKRYTVFTHYHVHNASVHQQNADLHPGVKPQWCWMPSASHKYSDSVSLRYACEGRKAFRNCKDKVLTSRKPSYNHITYTI